MITSASSAKIQMVYVTYSTLILDQSANDFRYKSAITKKARDDQKMETVDVEITFFLSSSELKKRKKAVSIPYDKITLKKTSQAKTMETSANSCLGNRSTYNGLSKKLNMRGSTVANP